MAQERRTVRRVVTGNDAGGKSTVVSDERIPVGDVWRTGPHDRLGGNGGAVPILPTTAPNIDPGSGGSRWVFAVMPPWNEIAPVLARGGIPGLDAKGFHRTESVDYVLIMDGPVTLILDSGEVKLGPGDLVVQRNTMHSWRNDTDQPVTILACLVPVA